MISIFRFLEVPKLRAKAILEHEPGGIGSEHYDIGEPTLASSDLPSPCCPRLYTHALL
jgi:hypothetical protein